MITLTIPGKPQPKGSKRAFIAGKRAILVDVNAKTKVWENAVACAAQQARTSADLRSGPQRISITFQFARPKSHFRTGKNAHLLRDDAPHYHTQKPDTDKLLRTFGDALTGVLLTDDCIIAHWSAWKVWGPADETTATIETMEATP